MRKDEAIIKIRRAATEAKLAGVQVQFMVAEDDWSRPLKTAKGAITKLSRYARRYLWGGNLGILFIGDNGTTYWTIGAAKRYGSKGN
jgi:hypothetical protein